MKDEQTFGFCHKNMRLVHNFEILDKFNIDAAFMIFNIIRQPFFYGSILGSTFLKLILK